MQRDDTPISEALAKSRSYDATRYAQDYILLTDMVKKFGEESILYDWLRNRNTTEFLGIWELIDNPGFKPIEFDRFKNQPGLNRFALSPKKWVEATGAIGTCQIRPGWRHLRPSRHRLRVRLLAQS